MRKFSGVPGFNYLAWKRKAHDDECNRDISTTKDYYRQSGSIFLLLLFSAVQYPWDSPGSTGAVRMKNKQWLCQLSQLTGLPYYEEHRIFGDKSGALIGISEGYIVALGLGKADGGHSAIKMLLRYPKAQDPQQIKQALDPAKGKFKLVADETTATLVRTYSFGKADAASVADQLRVLLAALKTSTFAINGKCEECGRAEPQIMLLNDVPTHYCSV